MIRSVLSGIKVDKGTLGFDVIEQVGPGGNYVMEDHTVEHMMSEFFYPNLSMRSNFDVWEEKGRPDMLSRANDVVHNIFREEYPEGLLSQDMLTEIRKRFPGVKNM
jgi:trimethylamine--corrinoid protein Co-methyltransferase